MATDAGSAQEPESCRTAPPVPAGPGHGETEERALSFHGFRYTCRITPQSAPRTLPVLILGGSEQDRHSWLRQERRLAPVATVITVDLPGYGDSDFLPVSFGIDFLSGTVRHLLEELRIPRVNLVGACFGGAVGLRFAQHCPDMLERLALIGMCLNIPPDYATSMRRWAELIERGETSPIAQELTERFMSPPGASRVRRHAAVSRLVYAGIAGQSPERKRKSAEHNARLMRHEWYRPGSTPDVPALVVTGEFDTLTTPAMGREVARRLPGARFLTVKETDHLAPVERPDDFADLLVRFCTDLPLDGLPYAHPAERFGVPMVHP
ncbi:alpha/beta fold hydrolase [Streptomyces cinereoruber]|uniref:alpha/beta fold hydrolase n=1 Tax=Streptomyces cinereoruber TaxID=67260 RepID=UPI003C2E0586